MIDKPLTMMKKIILSAFIFSALVLNAQTDNSSQDTMHSNWTFGGGIGASFGSNNYFNLSAAPRVGYRFTDNLEGGALGSISWQKSNYYRSTMFGLGPFLNYYFARSFFVSANYQHYFINYKDTFYDFKATKNEDALYLGGGYMQSIGNNSYLQLGLMYNVLWKENSSIFSSGLVPNIGFVIGL